MLGKRNILCKKLEARNCDFEVQHCWVRNLNAIVELDEVVVVGQCQVMKHFFKLKYSWFTTLY